MESFFKQDEIAIITQRLRNLEARNVVFCSFESRFARSGGLAVVTRKILPALARLKQLERVILLSPFYPYIIDEDQLTPSGIKPFEVSVGEQSVRVELLKYSSSSDQVNVDEYYLKVPGFFNALNNINDPYGYYPEDPEKNDQALRRNALFYCKAVPLALRELGIRENIVFHLQEWQTALVSLTGKEAMLDGTLTSCGSMQTMHNPFDSWFHLDMRNEIPGYERIWQNPGVQIQGGFNANHVGLRLTDAPLTTVSEQFARELNADRLQTQHFAPHLQDIFKKKQVIGINNGMFIDFPADFSLDKDDSEYTVGEIREIKLSYRKILLDILESYHPAERFGQLTYQDQSITRLPGHVPLIVMTGRLDTFQKGFDILLQAIRRFSRDEVKFVLTPTAMNHPDLDYFRRVASDCAGNVTVIPIRMEKGYLELLMGSTFAVMPSIYEPFGAAIEFMVNGTVTIARETGGLINQIQHKRSGFLYREAPGTYTLGNIKAFAWSRDAVQEREQNPWAVGMANQLHDTIVEACHMYRQQPNDYYRLILQGLTQARCFSWQSAAEKYCQIYQQINRCVNQQ